MPPPANTPGPRSDILPKRAPVLPYLGLAAAMLAALATPIHGGDALAEFFSVSDERRVRLVNGQLGAILTSELARQKGVEESEELTALASSSFANSGWSPLAVVLLPGKDTQALAVPGGLPHLSGGWLTRLPGRPGRLALLAHLAGHELQGHVRLRLGQGKGFTHTLKRAFTGRDEEAEALRRQLFSDFMACQWTEQDEIEADRSAADLLRAAGVPVQALHDLLASLPDWPRHPVTPARLAALEK